MCITIFLQAALWIWFLGCTVKHYRIGRHLLVEGNGVKSAEFLMLCLYSLGLLLSYLWLPIGKWLLFVVLVLWFVIQFFCHWYFTIFGASKAKLEAYNECFHGTLRLFPVSETRLVPDLYHIILHLLISINIILSL